MACSSAVFMLCASSSSGGLNHCSVSSKGKLRSTASAAGQSKCPTQQWLRTPRPQQGLTSRASVARKQGRANSPRGVTVRADIRSVVSDLGRQTYGALQNLGSKDNDKVNDGQKKKRADVLEAFFTDVDKGIYDRILADDCTITKPVDPCDRGLVRSKEQWMDFIFNVIKPAIPDFTWGALVGAEPEWGNIDKDGWCVCSIQVCGHHTGAALEVGQLPPLSASGSHFCFPQQQIKLKIDTTSSKITSIEMVPKPGTNVVALYRALGGSIPKNMIDTERSLDDKNICVKGAAGLGPL